MNKEQTNIKILELIAASLANEISVENKVKLESWLNESHDNDELYNNYVKTWGLFNNVEITNEINIDAEWEHFKKSSKIFDKKTESKVVKFRYTALLKYAASAIIIATLSILTYYFIGNNEQKELFAQSQALEKTLPDGSTISLNSNSKLTYPKKFNKSQRKVKLTGEAFFEVSHNPEQPFIIEAGNVLIEDVGTSFYVRYIADENKTEVVVKTGKVAVYKSNNPEQKTFLEPGEHGIFGSTKTDVVKLPETNENYIAWKTHKLNFENENLQNVIKVLERTYNKKIIYSPSIANCKLTVSFNEQSLNAVLNVLKATLNLNIVQKQNYIEISGTGCEK